MTDVVIVTPPPSTLVVSQKSINTVRIIAEGPQGPPGPEGPAGPGSQLYTHVQEDPLSQWNIQHDLDRYPHVTLITTPSGAGEEFLGRIVYVDENNLSVVLNQPVAGRAELR